MIKEKIYWIFFVCFKHESIPINNHLKIFMIGSFQEIMNKKKRFYKLKLITFKFFLIERSDKLFKKQINTNIYLSNLPRIFTIFYERKSCGTFLLIKLKWNKELLIIIRLNFFHFVINLNRNLNFYRKNIYSNKYTEFVKICYNLAKYDFSQAFINFFEKNKNKILKLDI